MTKKNFVFAASFLTMLVVNAAWADIASTNYADKKVAIAQGGSNKNKAVITDASGNVKTGLIAEGMIDGDAVTRDKIASSAVTSVKIMDATIEAVDIADGAVTTDKIAAKAVTTAKINDGAVTVVKTTGIYGYIPAGTDKSETAEIWVE